MKDNLNFQESEKNTATRWNTLIQVARRAITPLTNIILAHILAPEIFGIIASITLVISFLDVFTEAGFQKYLVYCEAEDEADLHKTVSLAFLVNLGLSLFLFALLVVFRDPVAALVGVPGKGAAVVVAALALPLTSFSSIQQALFQRQLRYQQLFRIQLIGSAIPLVITIPLALLGVGYWALLIGKVCGNIYNAIAMTIASKWKPTLYFSTKRLKKMLGFCSWSLGESVTTWLATNLDILIVGSILSSYYLGLYKTSISIVNELLRIVSSSILPVTYAVISRLKDDRKTFNQEVYKSQQTLASIVLPMGVGVFLFKELATTIALGSQWVEAANLLGYWSLSSCVSIAFVYICDDVYRAIGKPRLSFYVHIATTVALIPAVLISAKIGYDMLIIVRPLLVIVGLIAREVALRKCTDISLLHFAKNSFSPMIATGIMAVAGMLLRQVSDSVLWQFASIGICVVVYFVSMYILPGGKSILSSLLDIVGINKKKKAGEPDQ